MTLKFRLIVVTTVLVIACVAVQVHCKGHHSGGKSHKRHNSAPRGKKLLERSPRELPPDDDLTGLCVQACTKSVGSKAQTFGSYDQKSNTCVCLDKSGATVKRTLKKGDKGQKSSNQDGRLVISKGQFNCSSTSRFSRGLCKVFCQTFRRADSHECSNDGRQCLCYSYKDTTKLNSGRSKRQAIIESIRTGGGDELIAMDLLPPNRLRQPKHFAHGGMMMPYDVDYEYQAEPLSRGCSRYTCVDQCPQDCDSLCRFTGECYCSCPEDQSYEYYDEFSPFASILG